MKTWWEPHYLYVRVLWACGAPLSGTSLLLAMHIELGVPEDGHPWTLVLQSYGRTAVQLLLDFAADSQDNRNRQVDGTTWDRGGCGDLKCWTKANTTLYFKYVINTNVDLWRADSHTGLPGAINLENHNINFKIKSILSFFFNYNVKYTFMIPSVPTLMLPG